MPEENTDPAGRDPGGAAALPHHFEPRHRRFVLTESLIGIFMSGLLPAIIILLVRPFGPAPVFGRSGSVASGLFLGTLGPGSTLPVILSLVVRRRVRLGTAPGLGWPIQRPRFLRYLPRLLVLRGLLAGVVGLLVVPPLGLALMLLLSVNSVSGAGFILYNFVHGAALSALILPPAIMLALADGARFGEHRVAAGPLAAPPR